MIGPLSETCEAFTPIMNHLLDKFHRPFPSASPTVTPTLNTPALSSTTRRFFAPISRHQQLQAMEVVVKYTNEKVQKIDVLFGHSNEVGDRIAASLNKRKVMKRNLEEGNMKDVKSALPAKEPSFTRKFSTPNITIDTAINAGRSKLGSEKKQAISEEFHSPVKITRNNSLHIISRIMSPRETSRKKPERTLRRSLSTSALDPKLEQDKTFTETAILPLLDEWESRLFQRSPQFGSF